MLQKLVKMEKKLQTISYKLQFIDSARFMASSLSNHVNNLADGIHKIRCTYRHDNKKYETWGVKYKDCKCCLEYAIVKNSVIEYKFLCCNWKYQKTIDENLKKFRDTYIHLSYFQEKAFT